MGYVPKKKVYKLVFDDHEGLVVKAYSASLGAFFDMTSLAEVEVADMTLTQVQDMFTPFADSLIEWNIETENGDPVPATLAGIMTQDMDFVMELLMAWLDSLVAMPVPLDRLSKGGKPHLEASIPMEVLSNSQAS